MNETSYDDSGLTPGKAEGERDVSEQSASNRPVRAGRARRERTTGSSLSADGLAQLTAPVPKVIGPAAHAVLDYSTVATLVAMGVALRERNPTASTFAFVNAATVLVSSLLTDYPGGLFRRMSFRTHGMMDVAQAGMLASGPALLGFGRTPEAQWFYAQAAIEAGVVSATDWQTPA